VRRRLRAVLPRLHVLPALSGRLDQWTEWLVRTRYAGWSDEEIAESLEYLARTRDRVLDGAAIVSGEAVADVGAGTGLITLGAVERVGSEGDVLAIDVSIDALEELRRKSLAPNISYLVGSADVLPLSDASIDGVMTRSVLIYVDDKAEAAREFARVLRAGGRVSLFEPVNQRNLRLWESIDLSPLGPLAGRVREWTEESYANTEDSMLNFVEDDLVRFFADAGMVDVQLELRADETELSGERYLNQVGAPGRPTMLQRLQEAFPEDAERLAAFIGGRTIRTRVAGAFLTARKP